MRRTCSRRILSRHGARPRGGGGSATEGRGFEPLRACAQRFSRPPPYQLGLALPTAPRNLRDRALAGSPFSVRKLVWPQTDVIGRRVLIELNRVDAIAS